VNVSFGPYVLDELRALPRATRGEVALAMFTIEKDPWSTSMPGRWEMPFPWRPGTYCHVAGAYHVTYCRDGSDGEDLRYLHIRENRTDFEPTGYEM
jgi:hypothetical protein